MKTILKFPFFCWCFRVRTSLLVSLLSIIPIVYIGANRSVLVGTDNLVYMMFFKQKQTAYSFEDILLGGTPDILYNLFTYAISIYTSDYSTLCFWTTILTLLPVVLGIMMDDKLHPKTLALFVFLFMFYCGMLNIVRQGIALSFCFLALVFLSKDKTKFFFICTVIGMLFHNSAIIFFSVYILYRFISRGSFHKRLIAIIFVMILLNFLSREVLSFLTDIGILTNRYLYYIDKLSVGFSYEQFLIKIPLLIFCSNYFKVQRDNNYIRLLYTMIWVDIFVSQLAGAFGPLLRISYYFQYAYIMLIPSLYRNIDKNANKILFILFIVIYLMLYWYYFTVMNGYGFHRPVYPYIFNE